MGLLAWTQHAFDFQRVPWRQLFCARPVAGLCLHDFDPVDVNTAVRPQWVRPEQLLLHFRSETSADESRLKAAVGLSRVQCWVLSVGPEKSEVACYIAGGADAHAGYAWSD